jgi:transcriptional regulator with XRE-family HTH domain
MTEPTSPHGPRSIDDVTTPVWSKEMGQRLKLVRMKLLMDQFELSVKLDMPQSTLSNLENGRVEHAAFTLGKLKEVFHKHTAFILIGVNPERYHERMIHYRYWDFRLRVSRKNAADPAYQVETLNKRVRELKGQKYGKD